MRALSVRQPWAELILRGRKTVELRTWHTHYRGPLAIHASQTVREGACLAFGLDPSMLPRGALVGTVELVSILPLDEGAWTSLRDQHLSLEDFPGPRFGWVLENPQRLPEPIPMRGRVGLFKVPREQLTAKGPLPPGIAYAARRDALAYNPAKPFELRVVPREDGSYGLALHQWPVAANHEISRPRRLVELTGGCLQVVADHVLEALRKSGYKVTDLSPNRRQPFRLDEETGLRLGLLFLAVRPLTRIDRVDAISSALRTMPSEEAYYWFSKCTDAAGAARALRALRILLAGE